jgi:hypothetical protein
MAIKKQINIDVNASTAIKTLEELGGSFEDANGEGAIPLSTTIGELEDRLYAMAAAGDTASKEFKEISGQVGKMKKVIIDTDLTLDGMSQNLTQNVGGALQGVAGGFAVAQGAMGAFGAGGEDVEKALLKVQSAMALSQGIQGIKESLSSFKALRASVAATAIAQSIYTAAIGTTTGAMKLFRLAMIATGIGAIVIGIVALAMNFKKVSTFVKNLTDKMGVFGQVMKTIFTTVLLPFTIAIKAVMSALESLGIVESKAEKASAKAHKKKIARINEQIELEKKLREERAKQHEKEQRNLDTLIELAAAEGKSVIELQKQKIKGSIAYQKEQIKEIENSIKQIENIAASGFGNSKLLEEGIKEKRKALETTKIDIEDSEKDLLIIDINAKKNKQSANKAAAAENLAANRRIKDIEISLIKDDELKAIAERKTKFARDIEDLKTSGALGNETKKLLAEQLEMDLADIKKKATDKEKQADEKLAQFKKAADEKLAADKEAFEETLFQQGLTKDEAEIQAVTAKYFNLISLAEQYGLDTVALKEKETAELDAISKASADRERELDQAVKDAKLSSATLAFGALGNLATAFASNNEKSQKRAFKINKAVQLAQALISTYQGANAIFASAAANPATVLFPAQPFIAAGAAIAAGLANVANISRTKFQGGGGGASSASAPPSLGSGGGSQPAQFNTIGGTGINQLAEGLGGQNSQPVQAYVVSGDVTTAQSLDRNKIDTATI